MRAQRRPGVAAPPARDRLRPALRHDPPAAAPALGAEVDDPVRRRDDVEVVLDDQHRMARREQRVERRQHPRDVLQVQPGGRLVEHEQAVAAAARREALGELQPLCLAARERRHRLAEPQVAEPHRGQRRKRAHHLRGPREERQRVLDGHLQHVRDRPVPAADLVSGPTIELVSRQVAPGPAVELASRQTVPGPTVELVSRRAVPGPSVELASRRTAPGFVDARAVPAWRADLHVEHFVAIASSVAVGAAQVHVAQELHLHVLEAVSAAARAAPVAGVEAERPRRIPALDRHRLGREQLADRVERPDVARGVRAGGLADGRLVHEHDVVERVEPVDRPVLARGLGGAPELLARGAVEHVHHQRGLPRAADPAHAHEAA